MKYFSCFLFTTSLFISQLCLAADGATLNVSQVAIGGGSVPVGATRVPMQQLTFAQPCGKDTHVRTIVIHHSGLGSIADIANVYALDGTTRITRGSTFNAHTSSATLRFNPPLSIAACSKRTITIAMDLSAQAAPSSQHVLTILSSTDINADVPLLLQTMKSNPELHVTPKANGSVTFSITPLASPNVLFGKGRTLLRFTLKASNDSNQQIDAITFTNDGSARDMDLQNLSIQSRNGRMMSDASASLREATIRITFSSPFIIHRNQSQMLLLLGDVTASKRKTIRLTVQEQSDIESHPVRGS